jgi:hypothetical protein
MQGLLIDRKEIIATQINSTSFEDMSRDGISQRMAQIQRELAAKPKRIEVIELVPRNTALLNDETPLSTVERNGRRGAFFRLHYVFLNPFVDSYRFRVFIQRKGRAEYGCFLQVFGTGRHDVNIHILEDFIRVLQGFKVVSISYIGDKLRQVAEVFFYVLVVDNFDEFVIY